MVSPALGLNYKSIAHVATDMAYFNTIGVNKIRVHIPFTTQTASITEWRAQAKIWHDAGFYTIWGLSQNALTSANWQATHDAIVAEAAFVQANPCCSEFQVGNEYEYNHDGTISDATLRANVRQLATDVKAVLTGIPISYSTPQDKVNGWVTDATLGGLDILQHNVYGAIMQGGAGWDRNYYSYLTAAKAFFKDKIQISEFNIDSFDNNFQQYSAEEQVRYFREFYEYLKSLGYTSLYYYQYRDFKDSGNQFSVALNTGGFIPMWDVMLNDSKRRTFI